MARPRPPRSVPFQDEIDEPREEMRAVVVGVASGARAPTTRPPPSRKEARAVSPRRPRRARRRLSDEDDVGPRPAEREKRCRGPRLDREAAGAVAAGIERQRGESRRRRPIPGFRDPEHAEAPRRSQRRVPPIVRGEGILVGFQDHRTRGAESHRARRASRAASRASGLSSPRSVMSPPPINASPRRTRIATRSLGESA